MPSNKKNILLIALLLIALVGAGFAYWYFMFTTPSTSTGTSNTGIFGFQPFGRTPTGNSTIPQNNNIGPGSNSTSTPSTVVIPTLRLLSDAPVGGYGASTTPSETVVRWVDRGRGNVFEISSNTLDTTLISNTLVPRSYTSVWNKNLTSFISSILEDGIQDATTLYASLQSRPKSTVSSTTPSNTFAPYELKGRQLPENMITYAASPRKDSIFMLINENGTGVGYVSTFEGTGLTRIFDTPSTQLTAEWPEENTIAITTKPSFDQGGFLYFVNPKTGTWKKVLGPVNGLSTRISRDGKYILASFSNSTGNLVTSFYTISSGTASDPSIQTLAEKCVWGNFYKQIVYCAVPTQTPTATYPDDWHKGKVSFSDKIWQVNVLTGEVTLLTSLADKADRIIDAVNLQLDDRDDFLFFVNKTDLSLWSLDLVANNN
jgi:hypothetical protein